MSTAPQKTYTVEEYLALEKRSEIKHEFYLGEVFAMAGASRAHVRIADNIFFRLRRALEGRGCQPSSSDQRIYIRAAGLHTYPDVSVVCGELQSDPKDPEANTNPVLLVEVLSSSSERYDRTAKFRMYKKIASLREYILVSQNEALVEKFRRDENNNWITSEAVGLESSMPLPSIDCELALADIYEGVELDPPPPETTTEFHERPPQ
jgi:Uma2 family endonuclease